MINKNRSSGLTLVELIITISLVLVLSIVALSFVSFVTKFSNMREARMTAADLAYSIIEHLNELGRKSAADFNDDPNLSPEGDHLSGGDPVTIAGIAVPAGYGAQYNVLYGYWNDEDPDNQTNPNTVVNYKRILVTCTYPGGHVLTMTGYVVEP